MMDTRIAGRMSKRPMPCHRGKLMVDFEHDESIVR